MTPILAFYLIISESEILGGTVLKGLSCFFGGVITYLLYKKIAHIRLTKLFGSVIEIAVVILVFFVVQSDFKYQNIAATILFYIVILVFSFESGVISNFLKLKLFQELGKLSYSIYMIHAAILFCLISTMIILQKFTGFELAPMLNEMRYLTSGNEMINNVIVFLILGFVVLISQFTYKHIELKWQKKGRSTSKALNIKGITSY